METAAATGRARARGHAPLERVVVPVRFALLRLRRRWPQALAAALGVAAGAAVLALTVVGSAAVQDRALQQALAQLQPSDRAIEAVWSGVPAQSNLSFPRLDAVARARTTSILGRPPFRVVVFRQATWGGVFVNLGAVDGLRRWLTLERGRLPTRCTPTDCELVQIGGAPAQPKLPFLHVVGRAAFTAGAPLQAYFGAGNGKGPPILLADGVLPFVRTPLPDAALIARTYGWIVPVEPRRVHDWQLASLDDRLNRAQSALERASDIFTVAAPTDTIAAARATSRVAAQRLLILGGDAAVLLLGFAVLASTRLRRDHAEVRRRLSWSGARGSQLLLVAVTEVAGLTAVATVVGWAAGSAAGALLSRHLGSPGGAVVAHSILTTRTLGLALGLGAVTAATMLVALRADELALGGLRVTAADAAALGALAAVLLALARGKADTAALQHSGTGVVLLMLPALVLFVLAVATARVLGPVLRGLERLARPSPPTLRVAILSLARSPGDVMLTVVFFVLSVGIAVFAFGYRATLLQGERQQALYAVPAPYVLTEDLTKLVTVEQALPHGGTPVLRDSGYTSGTAGRDFTLLALPPRALAAIDGWRTDFSPRSPAQLASLLRPPATPRLRTILRLDVARTATLRFTTTGDMVGVSAVVADRRGDFTTLLLGEHGAGRHAATVRVPPEARGGRIVAFRVSFPVTASYVAAHRAAETSHTVNDASVGSIRFAGWAGTHRFVVNNGADAILRPREPLEGEPVPVVASPALAAAADASGIVPLHVENETVPARIVATARYFPSVDGDLVVADLGTWLAAANTADPGTATPSELWRTTAPPRGTPLDVASQRTAEQSLADDPLARGAIALLLVTAVVGLVLAAVGVLLTVLGDLRDERGALFDLSAQGSTPSELRRHLLVRAGAVASLGLVAGAAAGAIVAALVVAVVTVSAGAQQALPPLLLAFDWPLAAAALGAAAIGAAGSAALAVRRLR